MPQAIPLVLGAASIGAGASAIAAGSALVGGLMVAGGALSMLGVVTGNKKLSQLGGILGIAGGVAGMASGAWASGAETLASGSAATPATALAQTPVDAAGAAAGAAGSGVTGLAESGMGQGFIDAAMGGGATGAEALAAPSPMTSIVSGQPLAAGATAPPGSAFGGSVTGAEALTPAGAPTVAPSGAGGQFAGIGTATPRPGYMPGAEASDPFTRSAGAFWNTLKTGATSAGAYLKANPSMALMGAGLLQGASQGYAAEKQQQRQYDEMNKARARYNGSLVGLQAPVYRPAASGG